MIQAQVQVMLLCKHPVSGCHSPIMAATSAARASKEASCSNRVVTREACAPLPFPSLLPPEEEAEEEPAPPTAFITRMWCDAWAATWGRWVTQRIWEPGGPAAMRRSMAPTCRGWGGGESFAREGAKWTGGVWWDRVWGTLQGSVAHGRSPAEQAACHVNTGSKAFMLVPGVGLPSGPTERPASTGN